MNAYIFILLLIQWLDFEGIKYEIHYRIPCKYISRNKTGKKDNKITL